MAAGRPGEPLAGVVATAPPARPAVLVSRWSRAATVTTAAAGAALVVLALAPYLVGTGITQPLVTLFLLVSIAVLWNLLAGYAGMLSFGQQAYLGIGAYVLYLVSKAGVSPFAASACSCTSPTSSGWAVVPGSACSSCPRCRRWSARPTPTGPRSA